MSTEVRIPTTGNAGENAVIVEWKVDVGGGVAAGDVLLVIETAKSSVEVESPASGVLLHRIGEEGDEIAEFAVAAIVGQPGEAVTTTDAGPADSRGLAIEGTAAPVVTDAAVRAPAMRARGDRTAVSPRARRLAAELGIDAARVTGSGPLGRVVIADVLAVAAASAPRIAPAAAPAGPAPKVERGSRVLPVRGARKVTAQRMHESLASTAQVTITRYANADRMLEWVARLKAAAATKHDGVRFGVNDAVHFAVARTLPRHPAANSWFSWDGITEFDAVHLGFAVDTGSALLVPVIRDADQRSITDLARAARSAIDRARAGKLATDEMSGGTFTVSNLGGAGVHWFTPVLNGPQSGILGVGAIHRVIPEAPALLPLSLTFDHRAIDGSAAAALLTDIATSIENVDVLDAL